LASMRKGRFLDWEAEREKENASRRPAPQASVVR